MGVQVAPAVAVAVAVGAAAACAAEAIRSYGTTFVSTSGSRASGGKSGGAASWLFVRNAFTSTSHRLMTREIRSAFLTCVTALLFGAGSLMSQETPAARVRHAVDRVPVTVALVEQLPHGAGLFEIVRRAGASPHDVILLSRTTAGEEELSEAIRTLLAARQHGGDLPTRDASLRERQRNGPMDPFPWAGRVLRDVRNTAPRPLPGHGDVSFVQIWLPKQRPQGR